MPPTDYVNYFYLGKFYCHPVFLCPSQILMKLLFFHSAYVVVYFAGHGIHYFFDYLMPVDIKMDSDYSVRDLVDGNEIIARIQQKNPKLLVVLLDMCRTIPQQGINPRITSELPRQVPRDSRSNLVMAWATAENSYAFEVQQFFFSPSSYLFFYVFNQATFTLSVLLWTDGL